MSGVSARAALCIETGRAHLAGQATDAGGRSLMGRVLEGIGPLTREPSRPSVEGDRERASLRKAMVGKDQVRRQAGWAASIGPTSASGSPKPTALPKLRRRGPRGAPTHISARSTPPTTAARQPARCPTHQHADAPGERMHRRSADRIDLDAHRPRLERSIAAKVAQGSPFHPLLYIQLSAPPYCNKGICPSSTPSTGGRAECCSS